MTQHNVKIDDKTLIEMTIKGNTECFSVLLDRHATAIKRCVRSMVKRNADVEDILQNTLLKAWTNLSCFRFEASFRSWLTRVAINEVFAHYRYLRCRPSSAAMTSLDKLVCVRQSPEQVIERAESAEALHRAIARLPHKYREIVTLCDIQQLTAAETARHLNASLPLVKTRRFRARNMLCVALKRRKLAESSRSAARQ